MKPLAKSTGVTLEDHIKNLLDEANRVLKMRPFVIKKYKEFTGEDFGSALKQSARWHDEGKLFPVWQDACQKDHAEFQRTGKDLGTHLKHTGIRHEMASLVYMERKSGNASLPIKVAVAAHHGKLSRRHEDRWNDKESFNKFWQVFLNEHHSIRMSDPEGFEKAILKRYRFAGPRAWLQMIDHRASATEQNEQVPQLQTFNYEFPHAEKRGVQCEIENLWDEPFAILRAPTGAGKTDAALIWAQHQVEMGRADRLIIAMPTRFTANALSIGVTKDNFKNIGDAGLYHSSAWYQRIKDKHNPTVEERRFIDKEQGLARKLETPFAVTTIDHLCICLTGTREDHHAIFFGLAHACLVIDEADFYDDFTQQNIVTLLRALRLMKVPVLLMSATVPESARETYSASGFTLEKIYEDKTDYERTRCIIKRYGPAERPQDVEELLERAVDGEPTIIYANTVARAQAYYRWFGSQGFDDVVLYHSRFTEPHKVEKENKLIEMFGRKAWTEGKQYGVAILTQIGEISVNISADLMISDLCPLDRLAQRIGRLSRFAKNKGQLFVVEPYRTNKQGESLFYPAPYGTLIPKGGWLPNDALARSNELLHNGEYSAKTFVDLVNELYPRTNAIVPDVRVNMIAFDNCIVGNWLILPKEQPESDDDHTKDWKSRDIPPQYTVYADYGATGFIDDDEEPPRNKTELRQFEIRHGINIHAYEYKLANENGFLQEISFLIGDEEVKRPIVRSRCYNLNTGLDFTVNESYNDYE